MVWKGQTGAEELNMFNCQDTAQWNLSKNINTINRIVFLCNLFNSQVHIKTNKVGFDHVK